MGDPAVSNPGGAGIFGVTVIVAVATGRREGGGGVRTVWAGCIVEVFADVVAGADACIGEEGVKGADVVADADIDVDADADTDEGRGADRDPDGVAVATAAPCGSCAVPCAIPERFCAISAVNPFACDPWVRSARISFGGDMAKKSTRVLSAMNPRMVAIVPNTFFMVLYYHTAYAILRGARDVILRYTLMRVP